MTTDMTGRKTLAVALGVVAAVAAIGALATTTPVSALYVAPQAVRAQTGMQVGVTPVVGSSYVRTQAAAANVGAVRDDFIYRPVVQQLPKEQFSFNIVMASVASVVGFVGAVLVTRLLPKKQEADIEIALLAASGRKSAVSKSQVRPPLVTVSVCLRLQ